MPRLRRVVAPSIPHHVTQRGNRRQQTFFEESDFRSYERSLRRWCDEFGVSIWAYCLMPNHVHLIVVPSHEASLAKAIGEAHKHYTVQINRRHEWTGCLWQGRFFSVPLDEFHLLLAARYVLLNPVRAGLVERPSDWRYSSAREFFNPALAGITDICHLNDRVEDWQAFLSCDIDTETAASLRHSTRTGRPLGKDGFIERLEHSVGRRLRKRRPGPRRSNRLNLE